ncbi:MAG: zf-HC2 domain-containing protein [Armatimonadota bacterium]
MRCTLVRWWLDEYIDGRLSGRRLEWVQAHLQACRACAQELEWHRSLRRVLKVTTSAPSSQEMWQEFQQRLAGRAAPARRAGIPWWQVGTATAAVACVLVLGVVWWARSPAPAPATSPVSSPSETREFVKAPPVNAVPSPGVAPSQQDTAQSDRVPVKSRPKVPAPPRVAMRETYTTAPVSVPSQPAPQATVSMAYAEVRNADGDLVGKVLLQTTYDSTGQPKAVQIEMDSSAVVEVEINEQPMDNADSYGNTHGSAGGVVPAASTPPGISD